MDNEEYGFYKDGTVEAKSQIVFNPSYTSPYKNLKITPRDISKNISVKKDDFDIIIPCIFYLDPETWKIFHANQKKLEAFLEKDSQERLKKSLEVCFLGGSKKTISFYYENGKFKSATM